MQQSKYPNVFGLAMVMLCLFFAPAAMAQETEELINNNQNSDELSHGLDSHQPVLLPRENPSRDSVVVKPIAVRPKTAEAPTKGKTEDEPLSFNFLYYIIQKFKGSDVVE